MDDRLFIGELDKLDARLPKGGGYEEFSDFFFSDLI